MNLFMFVKSYAENATSGVFQSLTIKGNYLLYFNMTLAYRIKSGRILLLKQRGSGIMAETHKLVCELSNVKLVSGLKVQLLIREDKQIRNDIRERERGYYS